MAKQPSKQYKELNFLLSKNKERERDIHIDLSQCLQIHISIIYI
jgi:hypothetical protein